MKQMSRISAYLQGNRKGKEANHMEREALADPFLADALDGLTSVEGDHNRTIADIRGQLHKRAGSRIAYLGKLGVAASLIVAVIIASVFLKRSFKEMAEQDGQFAYARLAIVSVDTVLLVRGERVLFAGKNIQRPVPPAPEMATIAMMDVAQTKTMAEKEVAVKVENKVKDSADIVVLSRQRMAAPMAAMSASLEVDALNDAATVSEPVGGYDKFYGYARRAMKYPEDARKAKQQGDVKLTFLVSESGRPYQIRAEEGFSRSCNREAIRLVAEGPDWIYNNSNERVTVVISFRLTNQ